jgi:hypothetical protein
MNIQQRAKTLVFAVIFGLLAFSQTGCQREELNRLDVQNAQHSENIEDDSELEPVLAEIQSASCLRATQTQTAAVDSGNLKLKQFMDRCVAETSSSSLCQQVARPNPDSHSTFDCTYSAAQPHYFVHPDEKTWAYAITAVKLVKELQAMGVKVSTIYNWWRPEPYNNNVGGAAGRHPFGTSIDVRFTSKADQEKAHKQLCKWRSQGRLRALGYYSSTALHFGIGDRVANTWGKSCPN